MTLRLIMATDKWKRKASDQSREFSAVLEVETPRRIKAVAAVLPRLKAGDKPCPLADFFKADKWQVARYPEISRLEMLNKIQRFSSIYGGAPYWAIIHDKDETRAHCHLVFTLPLKKTKLGAVRLLKFALGLEQDRISVNLEHGDGQIYAIRYLMHLDEDLASDDSEKAPYPQARVWTNEPDRLNEAVSLKVRANGATTLQLIEVVRSCSHLTEVILKIGIEAYRKYRYVILDLWNEKESFLDDRVAFTSRLNKQA